jgi:hypothetical protein
VSDVPAILRSWPGWDAAVEALRQHAEQHGNRARLAAEELRNRYRDVPAAMVLDSVASRQRKYATTVRPFVRRYLEANPSLTLRTLSVDGARGPALSRNGEPDTVKNVAIGLVRFADERGLSETEAVRVWADATGGIVAAHRLDPYVGRVKGIGIALFAYLRMLAGADGLKPDVRVRQGIQRLGFPVVYSEVALLQLGAAIAPLANLTLSELDQLLWLSEAAKN